MNAFDAGFAALLRCCRIFKLFTKVKKLDRSFDSKIDLSSVKVAVLRPGGLGDFIHLVHAMELARIDLKCVQFVLSRRSLSFARTYGLRCNTLTEALFRRDRFDIVFDTEQRYGLSRLISLRLLHRRGTIIGFSSNRLGAISTEALIWNQRIDAYLNFNRLFRLGCSSRATADQKSAAVLYDERRRILDIKRIDVVTDDEQYDVLWLAGEANRSRRLDANSWANFLLSECVPRSVKVIGLASDRRLALEVKDALGDHVLTELVIGIPIGSALKIASAARGVYTLDGGAVHLCSFVGIPVTALFTSGEPSLWRPWAVGSVVRQSTELCAPCNSFGRVPPCVNRFKCTQVAARPTGPEKSKGPTS